ncbi:MAG: Eco57I restriction-modification methylase domain-containing protein [Sulfurovaceae bacterium]
MAIKLNIQTPSEFINPLLAKRAVVDSNLENFKDYLANLRKVNQNESEEHQKNAVRDFLKNSFGYDINTKGNIDWAISKNGNVEVIIEAKRLDNRIEMITQGNANKKALQEAIKYFFDERDSGNINLKHIIVLTVFEWFVFDAKDFERLFWNDRDFKKIYKDYTNPASLLSKTGDVYSEIGKLLASKKANLIDDIEIDCAYVDLRPTKTHTQKELIAIYKLLSIDSLLKEFNPNDANSLNREFYNELLYILGLEEVKDKGKKLIAKSQNPQEGSFFENITNKLGQYRKPSDFESVVGLIIIWINRILFLKLLEAQIIRWDKEAKKFLDIKTIGDFDMLESFFFDILGYRQNERRHKDFAYIPYLNSSLFEFHQFEKNLISLANLSDDTKMDYYAKTVIRDSSSKRKSGEVSTLRYLFEFLDAYSFGDEGGSEITKEYKPLISASVLGLIFEKINGYKDGSFYTPSFITMYMSRESLRKSIIDKFNEAFDNMGAKDFEEIKSYCEKHSHKKEFFNQANSIIDSLKICDPAVGSGHFLVSMLDEIIYTKAELGLFKLPRGVRIKLENDELIAMLEGEVFEYRKPKDFEDSNHQLQKLLFEEKKRIIENQLFGVDINPNSANITRLRLWVELLKNAYYHEDGTLETLPNIDINIKTGNSLISRYGLTDEITVPNIKNAIEEYKQLVNDYKEGHFASKQELQNKIEDIKTMFSLTFSDNSKEVQNYKKVLKEYVKEYGMQELDKTQQLDALEFNMGLHASLFGDELSSVQKRAKEKLFDKLSMEAKAVQEYKSGAIYKNAFEWRFEFPEVLDSEGNFVGFDIIIGNPPYIQLLIDRYGTSGGRLNTYIFFIHLTKEILSINGYISFIIPNTILTQEYYTYTREFLISKMKLIEIAYLEEMAFEDAIVETVIIACQNKVDTKYNINEILLKHTTKEQIKNFNSTDIIENHNYSFQVTIDSIASKLKASNLIALNCVCEINQGIALKGDKSLSIKYDNNKSTYYKVLDGKNINKYLIEWDNVYLDYSLDRIHSCKKSF